jgi:hypothetical protein
MGVRKIYECEQDGPSVIIWEGGNGTRVVFPTDTMAETAASWLISQANRFHAAKDGNDGSQDENMVAIVVYGDVLMTEFQFVRSYMSRVRKLGYEVIEGLRRDPKEFW